MRYTWLDRIAERLDLTREAWGRIGITIGITLIIIGIIIGVALHGIKAEISIFQQQAQTVYDQIRDSITEDQAQLDALTNNFNKLGQGIATNITFLNTALGDAGNRLNSIEGNLTSTLYNTLEGYLIGTFPGYTLYVKSDEAINFTADVHLVYSRAFGCNGTYEECQQYFCSCINWTQGTPAYATTITYNGTAWGISEVWFNIGTYKLEAHAGAVIPIICWGLNSTPKFAYVEVYRI